MIWGRYMPDYTGVVEGILREHNDRVASLPSKREQLRSLKNDIGDCKAQPFEVDRVQTSPKNDKFDRVLIRKEELVQEIEEIETEDRLFRAAWDRLTEQEQFVLSVFFRSGIEKAEAIERTQRRYSCERTKVYEMRQAALTRLKQLIL